MYSCYIFFLKKGKKRGEKSLSLVALKLAMPRIDTKIVFFPIYFAQMWMMPHQAQKRSILVSFYWKNKHITLLKCQVSTMHLIIDCVHLIIVSCIHCSSSLKICSAPASSNCPLDWTTSANRGFTRHPFRCGLACQIVGYFKNS